MMPDAGYPSYFSNYLLVFALGLRKIRELRLESKDRLPLFVKPLGPCFGLGLGLVETTLSVAKDPDDVLCCGVDLDNALGDGNPDVLHGDGTVDVFFRM